ncbi:MAG: hypothetical protein QM564_02315 [Bergeyella sp.]
MLSGFLAGLYIFAVVFSGSFHSHSVSALKNGSFQKEKTGFSTEKSVGAKDCLVCHFNSSVHFQLPDAFDFKTLFSEEFHLHTIAVFSAELKEWKTAFFLRGPPHDFV